MKQLILSLIILLALFFTNVLAQRINLVGTTWKMSYCICYGGDNDWYDAGTIKFLRNGRTNNPDQRWKLVGNVIKVTTTDIYGLEFMATIRGNQMTGESSEGMNRKVAKFRAVK